VLKVSSDASWMRLSGDRPKIRIRSVQIKRRDT
jgi:hypothetical protein